MTIQQCPALVTEGDNVTLSCSASGVPSPRTAWIREKTGEVLSSNKIHQITAIKSNESSNYLCLASNGIGKNSTKSCSVDVRCKMVVQPYQQEDLRQRDCIRKLWTVNEEKRFLIWRPKRKHCQ